MAVEEDDWIRAEVLYWKLMKAEPLVFLQPGYLLLRENAERLGDVGEFILKSIVLVVIVPVIENDRAVRATIVNKQLAQLALLFDCHRRKG